MTIRHYCMEIEVSGLVHIGNGNQYTKKDYFVKSNKIVILDTRKFVSKLNAQQVSDYCDFLQDKNKGLDLQTFLQQNADMHKVAETSIAYALESNLATAKRGAILYNDVWEFVKDAYGNPYIPGSSVKGMLRTAILLNLLRNNTVFKDFCRNHTEQPLNSSKKLEDKEIINQAFFKEQPDKMNSNILNDILKYISVSDSEPISVSNLVFAKKFDLFSANDSASHKRKMGKLAQFEGNELNIYRECLQPGTKVFININVDSRIDKYLNNPVLDAQGISTILQRSFNFYSEHFLSNFKNANGDNSSKNGSENKKPASNICQYVAKSGPLAGERCRNQAVGGTGFCRLHQSEAAKQQKSSHQETSAATCYIGGGVDFASKTVTAALFGSKDEQLHAMSRILYNQFPTKIDKSKHFSLWGSVERAGFKPKPIYNPRNGRLKKAKVDHRHWLDCQLGVAPHTMKYGKVGKNNYPMGKCNVSVQSRD